MKFSFLWSLLGIFAISKGAGAQELDLYRDPILKYVPTIPGVLVRAGYPRIGHLNLRKLKRKIKTVHFYNQESVHITVDGGSRQSASYHSIWFNGDFKNMVYLPIQRLANLYGKDLSKYFLFHEVLGALRYSDQNYELSAFLGALTIGEDLRPQLMKTAYVRPFLTPRKPYVGRFIRDTYAEGGGSHGGGGGDEFAYFTKLFAYLDSVKLWANLESVTRTQAEEELIQTRFELLDRLETPASEKELGSLASDIKGHRCPPSTSWMKISPLLRLVQFDRAVIENPQFDPSDRLLLMICANQEIIPSIGTRIW